MTHVPAPAGAGLPAGRLIGIDHGARVLGVAVCDVTQTLARPLTRITRVTRERDFAALFRLIEEQGAVAVVVGYPQVTEGFTGESQAPQAENWAKRLAGIVTIPVYLWDETLSTFEAREILRAQGRSAARVDDVAAAVILQSFLDARRAGAPLPRPVHGRRRAAEGK